jgi:hypothetical protein
MFDENPCHVLTLLLDDVAVRVGDPFDRFDAIGFEFVDLHPA